MVAGGGTGEKTVQLAQQMFDSHSSSNWRITHLDLSQTSIDIAKARAIDIWGSEAVQNHLKFVQGSLLNVVDLLPYEEFDYIDCLGVLHTLHNPAHGLSMLKRVLKTNGGIGIMVYAPLGRAGIYNMQNMINMIKDSSSTQYNINLTKRLLKNLPQSNPLRTDQWKWKSLMNTITNTTGISGLVDLFLPGHDIPMSVNDIYSMVHHAELHFNSFVHPALYQVKSFVHDKVLVQNIKQRLATRRQEEAFVEMLSGNHYQHYFYVTNNPEHTEFSWREHLNYRPIPCRFDGKLLGLALRNLTYFPWKSNNLDLFFRLPTSMYDESDAVQRVLKHIDGKNTIHEIKKLSQLKIEDFDHLFGEMFDILNSQGKLYLSKYPVVMAENFSDIEMMLRQAVYPNMPRNGYHHYDCERIL